MKEIHDARPPGSEEGESEPRLGGSYRCAPVLIVFFNRPGALAELVRQVAAAGPRAVYLACDGPREGMPNDRPKVEECRRIAREHPWRCAVEQRFLDRNAGCARAVSGAVSWFFEHEAEGIVLEDDCHPSPDFFPFATELLDRYRDDERVMSISGTSLHPPRAGVTAACSYRFSRAPHVWGWASWARAWRRHRLEVCEEDVRTLSRDDLPSPSTASLRGWRARMRSCIGPAPHTWDFQWSFAHFRHRGLAITPERNLVMHVPGEPGTHMKVSSAWQGIPTERLDFPLRHPAAVEADAASDQALERTHCNHRPWMARKLWQLAARHRIIPPEEIRAGFDIDRFLANAHAVLAAAWLCALGLGTGPEAVLFACLCAVTAVRIPAILRTGLPVPARLPLALWGAFISWMAVSVAWSDTSLTLPQSLPGRWYLGPLLVVPANLSTRAVLLACAIPGAWWTLLLACRAIGMSLPALLTTGHVSETFAGIEMLAIAGMAAASAGPSRRTRAIGWLGLGSSMTGAALAMSRGVTVAIVAGTVLTTWMSASGWRSALRRVAASVAIAVLAIVIAWQAGIGSKMTAALASAGSESRQGDASGSAAVRRAIDELASGRGFLHAWTASRVPEAWFVGHGAKSWPDGFAEGLVTADGELDVPFAFRGLAGQRYFPHQLYLHTAYDYGAIGVALLAAFAAACWLQAWPTRRSVASAGVLSFTVVVGILGMSELQPNDRANAHLAAALLALVATVDQAPRSGGPRTARTLARAATAGVAAAIVTVGVSSAIRHAFPLSDRITVAVADQRFRESGNLLPDSTLFPGGPWSPTASGRGLPPAIAANEVRFDAGGSTTVDDGSFLELPVSGLPGGTETTFSFRVRGPEGSFIAARGGGGAGMSRIPLNGGWQRVHLTESTSSEGRALLRIGLVATGADEAPLPGTVTVELRDPQLVVGRGRVDYRETRGPGHAAWPLRWTAVGIEAPMAGNRLRWSGAMSLPPWQSVGLREVAERSASDPSGTNAANLVVEDQGPGPHGVSQRFECTSTGEWTMTVYVAAASRRACRVELSLPGASCGQDFDLERGTASGVPEEGAPDARIERVDGRWHRITLRAQATERGEASVRLLTLQSPEGDGMHAGDGRGALLVWGASVEPGRGSGVYVPTASRARSLGSVPTSR